MQRVLENLEKEISTFQDFQKLLLKKHRHIYNKIIIIFQRRVLSVIFQIADLRLTETISGHKKSSALGVFQSSTILHN